MPPRRHRSKRELAARVVKHLLHLIATVSPGAKRGSTAPFAWAKFMLVEAGDWQPRSLAWRLSGRPALAAADGTSIRERAAMSLRDEIAKMDDAYGAMLTAPRLALEPIDIANAQRVNLNELAAWAAETIATGAC